MAAKMEGADTSRLFVFSIGSCFGTRHLAMSLLLLLLLLLTQSRVQGQTQLDIVMEIKQELGDPPGLSNLQRNSICDVGSPDRKKTDALLTCTNGSVTALDFSELNLNSILPKSIAKLTNLTSLTLKSNFFYGSIPASYGMLTKLTILSLSNNNLTGIIPDELGNLKLLEVLGLSGNGLTGSLPKSLGGLHSLREMNLYSNNLSGPIPSEIGDIKTLQQLRINNNYFTGEIPPEIGNLPNLVVLQLFSNRLEGSIPETFGNLASLTDMLLYFNSLSGNIPSQLGNLGKLGKLQINDNELTGGIPPALGNLSGLSSFKLNNNNLTGQIPMLNFTKVKDFQVQNNYFLGEIPLLLLNGSVNPTDKVDVRVKGNFFNNSVPHSVFNDSADKSNSNCFVGDGWAGQKTPEECNKFYADLRYGLCNPCQDERRWLVFEGYCKCLFPALLELQLYGVNATTFDERRFGIVVATALGIQDWQVVRPSSKQDVAIVENLPNEEFVHARTWLLPYPEDRFSDEQMLNLTQRFESYYVDLKDFDLNVSYSYSFVRLFQVVQFGATPSAPPPKSHESNEKKMLVIVVITVSVLALLASCTLVYLALTGHITKGEDRQPLISGLTGSTTGTTLSGSSYGQTEFGYRPARPFTMKELRDITGNFDQERVIGKGGFGWVYKAKLSSGEEVAVKRSSRLKQFLPGSNQFRNEVELLWRVHHRNLVRLIGYCDEEDELLLVYEYMKNGSLADYLKGTDSKRLSWKERLDIAIGAARGLHYLHTAAVPPVIHRDIKPDNILLDANMSAGLSDLGISKLVETAETHITTHVAGTFGYLDPEYMTTRQLNDKSDVYSFGIVLLQLVTGKHLFMSDQGQEVPPLEIMVQREFDKGGIRAVIDKKMLDDFPDVAFMRVTRLALQCSRPKRVERPDMVYVLQELEQCHAIAMKHIPKSSMRSRSHDMEYPKPIGQTPPRFFTSTTDGTDRESSSSYLKGNMYVPSYVTDATTVDVTMSSIDKADYVQPR